VGKRVVAPLNRGWRYCPRRRPGSGQQNFDDGDFEPVTLPHSNVTLPWHGFDDAAYQFLSTYRRRLRLPVGGAGSRVFIDFDGVMTACTLTVNGRRVGEHRGGYVPCSFEVTDHVRWGGDNALTVEVDSTERPDIPPFGGHLDYLAFGGIYREARLRIVPATFLREVFAKPVDVLTDDRRVDVRCFVDGATPDTDSLRLEVAVWDGDRRVAVATRPIEPSASPDDGSTVTVPGLAELGLWELDGPRLYRVVVGLHDDSGCRDVTEVRTGLRDARFTPEGFFLNGRRIKLRGLNRHQTFPHVGGAMPARVQRRDAAILRHEYKCNAVRTSHYPQSPSFLDACDELGLLVFEEMPGWQHIGDRAWQDLACRDVEAMVRRDWNHPSIVLWGVRVNESADAPELYRRTNAIARGLDDSRQTSGVRYLPESELLEDVFALNDFGVDGLLLVPNHPSYLVSEFAGHMFPTKRTDNVERVQAHALLHATVHDRLAADDRYAGGFGWCAFDYNTHAEFGSGDRVCYHGVADAFRVGKPAAAFYRSQCDPDDEVVLEPAFFWAAGDHADYGGPGKGAIFSNCDHILAHVGAELVAELAPDRASFPHLAHAPFFFDQTSGIAPWRRTWGDLTLEGYLGRDLAVTRRLSGRGADRALLVQTDDAELLADGSDATRLVVRVTDEYGAVRPLATGTIQLDLSGPATVVGDNPVPLVGGVAVVWLRAGERPGAVVVRATHPVLGTDTVHVMVGEVTAEPW
jgi:beta-galactosidase